MAPVDDVMLVSAAIDKLVVDVTSAVVDVVLVSATGD